MLQHYGHKDLRIVSQSSPTGTQFLQAVGCAMVCKMGKTKEVVYVSAGEGTTSQGDFHEALNWASNSKAPVIFHIQDNEYAISTHRSEQTASSIYDMTSGYANLSRYDVDGTDFFETSLAFKEAVQRARRNKGPTIIVSHVVRLLPHSSSDDQRKYRDEKSLNDDLKKDPLLILESICIDAKFINADEFAKIRMRVDKDVDSDSAWAEEQDFPEPSTAMDHIYSSKKYAEEPIFNSIAEKIVIVDAINHALHEEMELNDKMIVYGQDIADPKGGVFTATKGLSDHFGNGRSI
jgi:Pyruvate/2-oxoglutarate dehydrogenase complex, dehydrogenase (E1) component, eukaryotic type, alpha subunit